MSKILTSYTTQVKQSFKPSPKRNANATRCALVERVQIDWAYREFVLHCPVCGDDHVHLDDWGSKRIGFFCEQGHAITVTEERGQTILTVTTNGEVEL